MHAFSMTWLLLPNAYPHLYKATGAMVAGHRAARDDHSVRASETFKLFFFLQKKKKKKKIWDVEQIYAEGTVDTCSGIPE